MEDQQNTQQGTQQATQPFDDPRRQGKNLSEMSTKDVSDIICVMHSNSPCASDAIRATMLSKPEHILQNEDLDGVTPEDLKVFPELLTRTRELALRMSSSVRQPDQGFRFGRNRGSCDILLTADTRDKLISNIHFKIYVHAHGSLMIEDCSTNGTLVDDEMLKSKDRYGKSLNKPAKRVLKNGSIICVIAGPHRQEVKFMVRIPNRAEYETLYEQKLRNYLSVRGVEANFSSVRESSFGNHWAGGTVYNFTGLLGKGAFATVYRVQTKNEGTIYAAKEIDKRRFLKNGVFDIKFDNELQIMRRLRHPNIVDYIDYQVHQNWIYIIMEYIPYGELSKELAARTRIPEIEVQQITRQTLRALDYLHAQNITHRDVKPDNILIASRNPLIVKLSDFGLSKAVVHDETFLKTFCGTLLYCAPEVYPGYNEYTQAPTKRRRTGESSTRSAPYDSSADMWSFGAVIFHLLAGKAPIMGRGENGGAQMLNNIMTKEVDFEPLRILRISDEAIDFIGALLNKHPLMRPKEFECFQHAWIRDIPDVLDYSGVAEVKAIQTRLENVEEEDEAEAEANQQLADDLASLIHPPVLTEDIPLASPPTPDRPAKKPKMTRAESTIPEHILYPHLPAVLSPAVAAAMLPPPAPSPSKAQPTLFGEIVPLVPQDSGLFGRVPPHVIAGGGQARDRLDFVSMNDFAESGRSEAMPRSPPKQVQQSHELVIPGGVAGSAASLFGAEAQLLHMKMDSGEEVTSDAPTPETTNPVTPHAELSSPEHSVSQPEDPSQHSLSDRRSRLIDVDLLNNEVAFAAEQRLRNEAREENARRKAETFSVATALPQRGSVKSMARTFAAPARSLAPTDSNRTSRVSIDDWAIRQIGVIASQGSALGQLKPMVGSFDMTPIPLVDRSTIWGRGLQCNARYHDEQDTRVPKFGMKVVFYASGVEEAENNQGDWKRVPGIRTIIATSATRGIWINGLHLTKESTDGSAALFGKIYTGDIITIVDSDKPNGSLKYEVEILFGSSAIKRPEKERPFVTQKEYIHHARVKAQSMVVRTKSNDPPVVRN